MADTTKYAQDSVLSCFWNLYISGKELDETRKLCVTEISVDEVISGSDSMTINISDPDMLFITDDIFKEGVSIRLVYGWNETPYTRSFDGFVSAIDIDFPDTGCPTLVLNCIDQTHLMNRKSKKRSWDNVTNADVVKIIAKEYGFNAIVEPNYPFKKEENISQDDTDINFLTSLCENETDLFMLKLIGKNLYYIRKGILTTPTMELHYREYPWDIISFSPKINIETRREEIENSDVEVASKTTSKAVANAESVKASSSGASSGSSGNDTGSVNSAKTETVYKHNTSTNTWEKTTKNSSNSSNSWKKDSSTGTYKTASKSDTGSASSPKTVKHNSGSNKWG